MDIPPASNEKWYNIINGKTTYEFEFFPLKLLLAKQRLEYLTNPTPETAEKCINVLIHLFEKNKHLQAVKNDLNKIFNEKGKLNIFNIFRRK